MRSYYSLSAESPAVIRDANGVPVEWTLLTAGDTHICQEGKPAVLRFTADDLRTMADYFHQKGELIPIDSEHYLFDIAERNRITETDTVRMFPGGVAAIGYGSLALEGEKLRLKVKWTDAAYPFLKEKIYKYFSPVIRGMQQGPLRITSVAMTNTPAINNLPALAARAEPNNKPNTGRKDFRMKNLNKALCRLTGREKIALSAETEEKETDEIAAEVEDKANALEQIRAILGLDPAATTDEIIAALKAEAEKAASADAKQQELDNLAASAERDAHAALVRQGRADRKIVDADMDYVNSLDSKALKAHLDHTAPKFPAHAQPAPHRESDAAVLTAEEEKIVRTMHLDRQKYIEEKKKGI